ncbi:potassium channel family protein [Leptospira levettii]|uniref:potassium channel family protein n=1 Tax=Leptospira levettii TaxID=2023178 RepID=UPI000C29D4EE|nr:potassium channel family protein [Leptospira levettii]PKA22715.1 ion transporter [Leptospira sp. mixed culture ATI2-C-A1]TGM23498.1 ion transporter [Leptospira levettii]
MNDKKSILSILDIFTLILSIYILGTLLIGIFYKFDTEQQRLLDIIDNIICFYFIVEFLIKFKNSSDKLKFIRWGWIDLISSIPNIDALRYGRIFRIIRIVRVLRILRSFKAVTSILFKNKPKGTFSTVALFSFLTIIFASVAILQVETDPNSNIKSAEDALWWSYVTVTTVGYGDKFPLTTEGRIIGAILMTVGVGLFGTFSGFVASWFLEKET